MQIIRLTDRHSSRKRADLSLNPRTGTMHLHSHAEGLPMRCVILDGDAQRSLLAWLYGTLGEPEAPAPIVRKLGDYTVTGPCLTLRLGEGENLRELTWDGELPSVEAFTEAAKLLQAGGAGYGVAALKEALRRAELDLVKADTALRDERNKTEALGGELDRRAAERELMARDVRTLTEQRNALQVQARQANMRAEEANAWRKRALELTDERAQLRHDLEGARTACETYRQQLAEAQRDLIRVRTDRETQANIAAANGDAYHAEVERVTERTQKLTRARETLGDMLAELSAEDGTPDRGPSGHTPYENKVIAAWHKNITEALAATEYDA